MSRAVNTIATAAGVLLIPRVDQALKLLLRRALGPGLISLRSLGSLKLVRARIGWARALRDPHWPVFNLADVAITVGAIGAGMGMATKVTELFA